MKYDNLCIIISDRIVIPSTFKLSIVIVSCNICLNSTSAMIYRSRCEARMRMLRKFTENILWEWNCLKIFRHKGTYRILRIIKNIVEIVVFFERINNVIYILYIARFTLLNHFSINDQSSIHQ